MSSANADPPGEQHKMAMHVSCAEQRRLIGYAFHFGFVLWPTELRCAANASRVAGYSPGFNSKCALLYWSHGSGSIEEATYLVSQNANSDWAVPTRNPHPRQRSTSEQVDLGATFRPLDLARFGCVLPEAQMASALVVVRPVVVQDSLEMPSIEGNDVIHALSPDNDDLSL